MLKRLVFVLALPIAANAQQLLTSDRIVAGKSGDVEVYKITYKSDDLIINGYLAQPKAGGKVPCVILNRGGNDKMNPWTDERAAEVLGRFASWGYVAIASQYRGANGAPGHDELGGADIDDVMNLIPVLEAQPRADATRIGMVGWSRGGMMTYLAIARTTRIAAAVVISGLADQNLEDRPDMLKAFKRLIPDYEKNPSAAIAARSAVKWADKLNKSTPILILHGTADWRAKPKTNAINMAAALLDVKQPFRMILYEGGQHGIAEFRDDVNRVTREWLDTYVRDRKPWPSLEPHGD